MADLVYGACCVDDYSALALGCTTATRLLLILLTDKTAEPVIEYSYEL